jgi:hypothetical protein
VSWERSDSSFRPSRASARDPRASRCKRESGMDLHNADMRAALTAGVVCLALAGCGTRGYDSPSRSTLKLQVRRQRGSR